jgi:succinate-semialdehyde dehydrogenase/glutarate-semialdehyde dehydrogenase
VGCVDAAEIELAVEAATFAAKLWRGSPFEERARRLARLASLVHDEAESLASLIALEQGKPFAEALALEILPALDHLRFLSRHARELTQGGEPIEPRHPLYAHKRALISLRSLGGRRPDHLVVAAVRAAAHPDGVCAGDGELGHRQTVVVDTADRASRRCLMSRGRFSSGLVNVVPASREDTLRLVCHDKVAKVFVTGMYETGQNIMAASAGALRPVVLSLGGKHPSIVAGDADIRRAARGIVWGALANAGQNCGAIERVYVEERVAATFIDAVLAEVDKVRTGDAMGATSRLAR